MTSIIKIELTKDEATVLLGHIVNNRGKSHVLDSSVYNQLKNQLFKEFA